MFKLRPVTQFLKSINYGAIAQAIEQAEKQTSAEIVVRVSKRRFGNPMKLATRRFIKSGLADNPNHNCVMIYVIPAKQQVAIVGDVAIHAKLDKAESGATRHSWDSITARVVEQFGKGEFTMGLINAIDALRDELVASFPPNPEQKTIVPNEVTVDK